jgi:hypothetical protein
MRHSAPLSLGADLFDQQEQSIVLNWVFLSEPNPLSTRYQKFVLAGWLITHLKKTSASQPTQTKKPPTVGTPNLLTGGGGLGVRA